MEGIQQYQRAVTPTMNNSMADNNNQIRGKMLSYSNAGGKKPSDFIRAPQGRVQQRNSSKSIQQHGSALEISGQSKLVGSSRGGGLLTSRIDLGSKIHNESEYRDSKASALMPRLDLEPLTEEIPTDGILFARFKNRPESLVVFRLHDERARNPERLNLDRRQLDVCPYLEQEQRLRLLNYQNNNIRVIQNLENLPNLIFLDMYNNKLTTLEGCISTIKGLRVLMVGKNQITELSNLTSLKKLDVLDLHSNQLREIKGLDGLADLRVLNLAGNSISIVNNLSTLSSLTELNLRRNCIETIVDLDRLPSLQRIFLSHNRLASEKNINCLFHIRSLLELSLDSNPIAEQDPVDYRQTIIAKIPRSSFPLFHFLLSNSLKHLDLKRITDEERAVSVSMLSKTLLIYNS